VEYTDNGKHSSLLHYGSSYNNEKFHVTVPKGLNYKTFRTHNLL
jgi:hypothetical protein